MERAFKEPKELEQVTKTQLRKELGLIRKDEEKSSSRDQICASELNFEIFNKEEDRQKIRREAQAQHLNRVRNEQTMQNLALQFASTQSILMKCLSDIVPQLNISFGLQNLERVINFSELAGDLDFPPIMEPVMDELQNNIIQSLQNNTRLLGKPNVEKTEEPPSKRTKHYEEESNSGKFPTHYFFTTINI